MCKETQYNEVALLTLRYHGNWIKWNMLDADILNEQYFDYMHSDDQNTEHYRWKSFKRILSITATPDDEFVDRYTELASLDEDFLLEIAAKFELVQWRNLSDEQLARLKNHPLMSDIKVQREIERQLLRSRICRKQLDDSEFEYIVSLKDGYLQSIILSLPEVDKRWLNMLAQKGATKSVRHRAGSMLKRRSRSR